LRIGNVLCHEVQRTTPPLDHYPPFVIVGGSRKGRWFENRWPKGSRTRDRRRKGSRRANLAGWRRKKKLPRRQSLTLLTKHPFLRSPGKSGQRLLEISAQI
jgi:hypothetical protein